jgi:phage major head subunit gpT-like protein
MRSYKGENGKTIRVNPTLLVVPPALEGMANYIITTDFFAPGTLAGAAQVGSTTNYLKNSAKVLVVPELVGDDTTWYLMDTSKPVKPFLWQQRKAPEFTYLNNPNDMPVFKRNEFEFGVHARGAMAYALWFLAAKCVA